MKIEATKKETQQILTSTSRTLTASLSPTEDDTGLQFKRLPSMSVEAGADETEELLAGRFRAVRLRLKAYKFRALRDRGPPRLTHPNTYAVFW